LPSQRFTVLATTSVVLAIAFNAVAAAGSPAQAAAAWLGPVVGTYLPTPASESSAALTVSATGEIGGWSGPTGGSSDAVLWRTGQLTRLTLPADAIPAPAATVNAQVERVAPGIAAGSVNYTLSESGGFGGAAVSWRKGTPTIVNTGPFSSIADLNREGDVLATTFTSLNSFQLVRRADDTTYRPPFQAVALDGVGRAWGSRTAGAVGVDFHSEAVGTDGTQITVLAAPTGRSAAANDAAQDGTVCGETFTLSFASGPRPYLIRTERHAALWLPDGHRVDLSAPGTESWCQQAPNRHVAAGSFLRADGTAGVVLWRDGRAGEVGPVGKANTLAAINSRGEVVGTTRTPQSTGSPTVLGFVATPAAWRALTAWGATSTTPEDINDGGIIVGTGTTTSGRSRAIRWAAPL
jgi:uncharacterized membrane protein